MSLITVEIWFWTTLDRLMMRLRQGLEAYLAPLAEGWRSLAVPPLWLWVLVSTLAFGVGMMLGWALRWGLAFH